MSGDATAAGRPEVEVRRSARRKRTVSAYRKDGRVVVLLPARLSRAEEERWVERMLERLERSERRRRRTDADLDARADRLAAAYLPAGVRPTSVRWVATMTTRWGSCTSGTGEIRLSDRLRTMPTWVQDYVLVHELAHLVHPDHGADFWALVNGYPRAERAQGFLDGVSHAEREAQGAVD
ncbi:M48 family metallopeptidase [Nocardioides marmoraquaticus]